jgi:hypothetical protein
MPRGTSARVKPGFNPGEVRDLVRMNRDAAIGESKTTQTLARKYRRDPAYLAARRWVWEQRCKGFSPEQIAELSEEHFGERITWPRVEAMIESASIDVTEPEAVKMRALENARLDWYLSALENRIAAGDDKAINTAIRISERRARMFGIDKPVQAHVHITGDIDPELQAMITDARDEQRELMNRREIIEGEVVPEETDDQDGYIDMDLGEAEV